MVILGSIVAWLLIGFGAIKTVMGFWVGFNFKGEENVAASAYYLAAANSGEAINEGMVMFAAGVVIGLLVKIAKNGARAD